MKTRVLFYACAAAGLLYAATFQSTGQDGQDHSPILTRQDRAAALKAARPQLAKLMAEFQAARKEAIETALVGDAKDEDIRARLEAVSKIQNQMALIWCKAVKESVDLTGDQIERMKENPNLGYATLFNPATAYAAGRQGGRQGGRRSGNGAASNGASQP